VRLTLVLPFLHRTGGVRLVLQWAEVLARDGHRVKIVTPRRPYRFHYSRRDWRFEFRRNKRVPAAAPWFLGRPPLLRVPRIRDRFLPESDAVVATSWPTAFDVARLAPGKGRKFHLLMHHEAETGPEEKIAAVYRLPLRRLALSEAAAREIEVRGGGAVAGIVPAGVDPGVFYPDGRPDPESVLMIVHPAAHKGTREGLAALDRVTARRPGLRVLLCGTVRPTGLPERFPFLLHPNDASLRRLYSTAGVFLYPSLYEGFGLPPLEAMACGCPVVSTRVGAVPEFARDGENALLAAPGDAESMARGIEALLADSGLRGRLIDAGRRTAAAFTVGMSAARFAAVLGKALK
jgi:glycosyltransferase involved in cell wall biosynthesis